ncbi:L-2-hydroxyglutarate oxidase [Planosporangium mesophilum]|uniref:Hydroxyglutarate oxidase n=1 Tax=Planosporangium mesophilum TaxID=689768 RepID=A0A8J3T7H5_9ACTN|nr:L-2-hydroxyglutarate oxidase [Planosporangium mesophilum]NJC81817.1 L-2-hydroxyglutarate oxidase [Planosporangium mesophilum]GII20521.1 hydroxyglutarate oxidase [Planosporangium mesophilum]
MSGKRYVVIGGGIVGLAVAHRLVLDRPGATVTVVEKEPGFGAHQTGHNSGVIHAGVYYRPGSLKAKLCRDGSASMVRFCTEYGIPVEVCGKLIVATGADEVPRLHALHERALANGLPVRLITAEEAREYEPHLACVEAMHVASTGIVDFRAVCDRLAKLLADAGAHLRTGERVVGLHDTVVVTTAGEIRADVVVNCAGLHADRIARLAGVDVPARIVPFRGEYHELRPERRELVKGLIYPVPDPALPFLGVHLTRMIDGSVHAGPNAVLALAREGYRWSAFDLRDALDAVAYPGLWRLARRHLRYGVGEVARSLSRRRFAASLARLVPEICEDDLLPAAAGVRAQAVAPDGGLVDDFLIVRHGAQVHVLNAPSPAATSSLEIARYITAGLPV